MWSCWARSADADTIDTAIKGAETGRLVIASMPTPNVITTIERILTTLPREEREIGRMRLSEALRAIVCQQLLPEKNEKGRVPAIELLIATPAVRECLKDASRMGELRKLMADGRKQLGTQTFEQHLAELTDAGTITAETAKAAVSMGGGPAPPPRRAESRPPPPESAFDAFARADDATSPRARARGRDARRRGGRDLVAVHLEALGYLVQRQRFAFAPPVSTAFPSSARASVALALLLLPLLTARTGARLGRGRCSPAGALAARCWPSGSASAGSRSAGGARGRQPDRHARRRRCAAGSWPTSTPRRRYSRWPDGWWRCGSSALAVAVLTALRWRGSGAVPVSFAGGVGCRGARRQRWPGRGRLRGSSPGARDNGSRRAPRRSPRPKLDRCRVGILITGAEEFGLVGARVFVGQRGEELRKAVVVNLDTIDQEGELAS